MTSHLPMSTAALFSFSVSFSSVTANLHSGFASLCACHCILPGSEGGVLSLW